MFYLDTEKTPEHQMPEVTVRRAGDCDALGAPNGDSYLMSDRPIPANAS